jgi:hypothetical protein
MQEDYSIHSARIFQEWFAGNRIRAIDWQPYAAGLYTRTCIGPTERYDRLDQAEPFVYFAQLITQAYEESGRLL